MYFLFFALGIVLGFLLTFFLQKLDLINNDKGLWTFAFKQGYARGIKDFKDGKFKDMSNEEIEEAYKYALEKSRKDYYGN